MTGKISLDPRFTLRQGTWQDVEPVANLTLAIAALEGDALFVLDAGELTNEWKSGGFEVERDVFVVQDREGNLVGSEEFYSEDEHTLLRADGFVHPDFLDMGIGSSLLAKAEGRARDEMRLAAPDKRVVLRSMVNQKNAAGCELLHNNGFSHARSFWRMEITLQEAPPPVDFPEGIELRPFKREKHARAVWIADNEAFRDHWSAFDRPFDDWSHGRFGNPHFDPNLWLIAWEGNEVAGFSQNRYRLVMGWIGNIAVRKPWRGRGLGIALLKQSFADFYARGTRTIGLGVDSENLTGATRLYERAGMHAASTFAILEKELRAASG